MDREGDANPGSPAANRRCVLRWYSVYCISARRLLGKAMADFTAGHAQGCGCGGLASCNNVRWRSTSEIFRSRHRRFEHSSEPVLMTSTFQHIVRKHLSITDMDEASRVIEFPQDIQLIFEAVGIASHSILNGMDRVHIRCSDPLFRLAASASSSRDTKIVYHALHPNYRAIHDVETRVDV